MEDGHFDIIIISTSLTQSITAAALSKAGFTVAHIDQNPYYGSEQASLSLNEFVAKYPCSSSASLPLARQYSISLSPSVIPSVGPLIAALIGSGVSKYGGFRMVDRCSIYTVGTFQPVPGSKEDVFTNKHISLVDKRRIMRFLMFASGDFEDAKEMKDNAETPFATFLETEFKLNDAMVAAITYSLAFCFSPSEPTLPVLQRLRRYLRSTGRYGKAPFLVGHYGSAGEIAQGFCRAAAVGGAAYILGRKIVEISASEGRYTFKLEDFTEPLSCKVIVSDSATHIPASLLPHARTVEPSSTVPCEAVARCVAIIDCPISFGNPPNEESQSNTTDTGILIFPPGCLPGGLDTAVTALVVGEGTMSTPQGKWIVYISTPISSPVPDLSEQERATTSENLLRPYLSAILACTDSQETTPQTIAPMFTSFYIEIPRSTRALSDPQATSPSIFISPWLPANVALPESPDIATTDAEAVFRAVVMALRSDHDEISFWPPVDEIEEDSED